MFLHGTKREMTDFVAALIQPYARLAVTGLYNPQTQRYERVADNDHDHALWSRIESLGEFGNRPLYLIESLA